MCEHEDFAQELVETRQKDWQAAAMLSQVVVGLRIWKVRRGDIYPILCGGRWNLNGLNTAVNQKDGLIFNDHWGLHAQTPDIPIGNYYRTLSCDGFIGPVAGLVAMWGWVYKGPRGFRGQYALPLVLCDPMKRLLPEVKSKIQEISLDALNHFDWVQPEGKIVESAE